MRCPDCGHEELSELPSELETHIQEDIVLVKVETTKFIRHGYWCPHCKAKKQAPYAPGEIPQEYLGPSILAQALQRLGKYLSAERAVILKAIPQRTPV